MRVSIAESIPEAAPFNSERGATDEPMTLEELAARIGQPELKTPMSQNLADAVDSWFLS